MPRATFPELVHAAGVAGFDAVTISPALHLAIADDDGTQARRVLDAAGVRVAVVDPLIRPLPGVPPLSQVAAEHRPFLEPSLADVLRLAEATGAESVNLAHFLGRAVTVERLAEAIGTVAEAAAEVGCQVSLEFIPDTGVPDLATARAIVRAVAATNLGIMVDSWHLARAGEDPSDVAAADRGSITGVQLCDRRPPIPGEPYVPMAGRLLPGDGELPLLDLVDAVLGIAPDITFGIEVFDVDLAAGPAVDSAAKAFAALTSVLPGRAAT